MHAEPMSAVGTQSQVPAFSVPDSSTLLWGTGGSYGSLLSFEAFA